MRPPLFLAFALVITGCSSPNNSTTQRPNDPTAPFVDASPRWSPDGKRIAFLRIFDHRRTQLWVADSNLKNPRAISNVDSVRWARPPILGRTAPVAPEAPAWSPDGRRIAVSRGEWIPFEGRRTIGGTGIWAYDVDSGRAEPIGIHPPGYGGDLQFYRAPQWSPDGRRIVYMAEGVFGYASVVVHTLGVTNPREQSPPVDMLDDYGWPAWSPDGTWLAFRHSLYRSDSALPVETIRLIAPGTNRSGTIYVKGDRPNELRRVSHVSWSPNGKGLSARLYSSGLPASGRPALFAVEDGGLLRLPVTDGLETKGIVATRSGRLFRLVSAKSRLLLLEGNGTSVSELPSDDFDISPDGKRLAYSSAAESRSSGRLGIRLTSFK